MNIIFFEVVFLHINATSEFACKFFLINFFLSNLYIQSESKKKLYDHVVDIYEVLWEHIFKHMGAILSNRHFLKNLKNYEQFFVLKTGFWKYRVFHPVAMVLCRRCVCAYFDFSAVFLSELLKHLDMLCSTCVIALFSVVFQPLFIFLSSNQ